MLLLIFMGFIIASGSCQDSCNKSVVCYYRSFRSQSFPPENIEPYMCTHVLYSNVKINLWNYSIEAGNVNDSENYKQLLKLKMKNPKLKILTSIGNSDADNFAFEQITRDILVITRLSQNVAKYLNTYGLDGVDIHWEFPQPRHKVGLSYLLGELRKHLGPNKIISLYVSPNNYEIMHSYDVFTLNHNVDLLLVASFNYHGLWIERTGINAPLRTSMTKKYSVDNSLRLWESLGITKTKLILGIPCFGPEWLLRSKKKNNIGDAGTPTYHREFSEVCVQNSSYSWIYSEEEGGTYANIGPQWVSMETPEMVERKAQYVELRGYGGVMFWEIGQDDFRGSCGKGKFPLVKAANRVLCLQKSYTNKEITPNHILDESPRKSIRKARSQTDQCIQIGMYRHPTDEQKFYWCTKIGASPLKLTCPRGTKFNNLTLVCDHIGNVVL